MVFIQIKKSLLINDKLRAVKEQVSDQSMYFCLSSQSAVNSRYGRMTERSIEEAAGNTSDPMVGIG